MGMHHGSSLNFRLHWTQPLEHTAAAGNKFRPAARDNYSGSKSLPAWLGTRRFGLHPVMNLDRTIAEHFAWKDGCHEGTHQMG
ncbi:hypothetical protein ACHMW7_27580 [Aminobacter sp. UC22_36]|uniref:hypothetical protein n=1 Tax=Aminobacter sp. UC22_36 TaxID=3374549 RepID=UPI0037581A68